MKEWAHCGGAREKAAQQMEKPVDCSSRDRLVGPAGAVSESAVVVDCASATITGSVQLIVQA
jgi:hypothetical protein